MPLDPMVLDYLKKRRNPYERDEMEDRPFYKDPQFAAAITQGLAQGVTLHGKSPDASAVQNFANYVTSKEEKRRQRDMMAKEFEDRRDSDILNRMASEKQREDAMSIARLKQDIDKNRYEKEFGLKEQESRNRAEDLRLRREQSSLDRGLKDRYYNILEKKANLIIDLQASHTLKILTKKNGKGYLLDLKKHYDRTRSNRLPVISVS